MSTKKKAGFVTKIRQNLKKEKIVLDPILSGVLEEMERLESIRNSLYTEYANKPLMEEYTNKAGATNLVVNAAVKEYKMYSQRFNDMSKTLEKMISDRMPEKEKESDPLDMLNGRDRL